MTEHAKSELEKEVVYAELVAQRNCQLLRVQLSMIGERLEKLGLALQNHPEKVNPLPEIDSQFDYRECFIEMETNRQRIIDLCNELRAAEQVRVMAERRRSQF